MFTIVENYSWIIILPVFGLLFMTIWNALNKNSYFSDTGSFMIALCVSVLCAISVIAFFTQASGAPQEIAIASQEEASSQEPQQRKFHFILLPYLALMMSFLLLLILLKIGLLADGINSFFRPSYGNKNKITTDRHKKENQVTKVKSIKSWQIH